MIRAMHICKKTDYIQGVFRGFHLTRRKAVDVLSAVAQACEEHGLHRVLLEFVNTEQVTSTLGAHELAQMAKNLRLLVSKIAILVQPGPINENMRSFEAAAADVGLRCKFFETEGEALAWLRTRG